MALDDNGVFLIRLLAEDDEYPRLPDISSFLYDTNLLHATVWRAILWKPLGLKWMATCSTGFSASRSLASGFSSNVTGIAV